METKRILAIFAAVFLIMFIISVYASTIFSWNTMFVNGQYYANASIFMSFLLGSWPITGGVLTFLLSSYIIRTLKHFLNQ